MLKKIAILFSSTSALVKELKLPKSSLALSFLISCIEPFLFVGFILFHEQIPADLQEKGLFAVLILSRLIYLAQKQQAINLTSRLIKPFRQHLIEQYLGFDQLKRDRVKKGKLYVYLTLMPENISHFIFETYSKFIPSFIFSVIFLGSTLFIDLFTFAVLVATSILIGMVYLWINKNLTLLKKEHSELYVSLNNKIRHFSENTIYYQTNPELYQSKVEETHSDLDFFADKTELIRSKQEYSFVITLFLLFALYFFLKQYTLEGVSAPLILIYSAALLSYRKSLLDIAQMLKTLSAALMAQDKINEIFDKKQRSKPPAIEIQQIKSLELQNVHFRYGSDSPPVLTDINFSLANKDKRWIQAPNGSGKTTFWKVLLGLYPATQGQVLCNGIRSSDINPLSLMSRVGVMVNPIQLPYNSLDDILMSKGELGEQLLQTEEWSHFMASLPFGGQTALNAEPSPLSSGQQKVLSFLLAIQHNPDILILDEPFANVDPFNHDLIQHFLEKYCQDMMWLIISHEDISLSSCKRYTIQDRQIIHGIPDQH